MSPSSTAAGARGSAVGALVGGLAIAAHGIAGAPFPSDSAATLLLATSAAVGAVAANSRAHSPVSVVALLAFGQLAGHFALSNGGGDHHHISTANPWLMALAHVVATVVCAALIVAAERLYLAASTTVRALTTSPVAMLVPARPHPTAQRYIALPFPPLQGGISRRGPPSSFVR
ncbi:hypothetical protein [Antrihabitans stalactiti]|uniref:Uncharacterized protein n=1 Tax=Antrihabitans stalactiti TaxID=2584121 RepID=A0A848KET8_9NOCA|nr:hypothetical protein [Antrihabitans stalactiti]NMN95232.1 hypothetical protein [Antrihabitans stalactiti]